MKYFVQISESSHGLDENRDPRGGAPTLSVETQSMIVLLLASTLVTVLVRLIWFISSVLTSRKTKQSCIFSTKSSTSSIRTLIVLGSGGHTSEILALTKHLDRHNYSPIVYVKASTDTTSQDRLNDQTATILDIPRSREVGQSYASSVLTTLYAFLFAFRLVLKVRPDLIICNGPGTCLPICIAAIFFRLVGIATTQIVFIESYCRVQTLSLTGKLLYNVVDLFILHWPQLQQKYPLSIVISTFARHD